MIKFKNNRILWVFGDDNLVILSNTTEKRFDELRSLLYKKYGSVYNLDDVKMEIINF